MTNKAWTVMVYLAGDNNLSEEMIYAVKEMYRVGVADDVDVIVQFDPSAIGTPVRRYVLSRERFEQAMKEHHDLTPTLKQNAVAAFAEVIRSHPEVDVLLQEKANTTFAKATEAIRTHPGVQEAIKGLPEIAGLEEKARVAFARAIRERPEIAAALLAKAEAGSAEAILKYPGAQEVITDLPEVAGLEEKARVAFAKAVREYPQIADALLVKAEAGSAEAILKYITAALLKQKAMVANVGLSQKSGRTGSREAGHVGPDGFAEALIANLASQLLDESELRDVRNIDVDGFLEKLREDVGFAKAKKERRRLRGDGEINSASPQALKDFVYESIKNHKAAHYILVLSGHGNGATGDFLTDQNPLADRPSSLSIPNLRIALEGALKEAKAEKIDILGMDSCMMSTAEVGYELKDSVDFLVASEGFVLNAGWPYHRILEALKRKSEMDSAELAGTIVKKYIGYYDDYAAAGASTDQSACDLRKLRNIDGQVEFVPPLRALTQTLQAGLAYRAIKDAVLLAHWEAQSYKSEQYVDLYDFCEKLTVHCDNEKKRLEALGTTNSNDLLGLIGDQLGHLSVNALEAWRNEKKSDGLWQLLYDQLDSKQIEVMTAMQKGEQPDAEKVKALSKEKIDALQVLLDNHADEVWALYKKEEPLIRLVMEDKREEVWKLIPEKLRWISVFCSQVMKAIENCNLGVVLKSCYSGPAFQHSHGLSVFFPWFEEREVLEFYQELAFAADVGTGWAGFLREYLRQTRRERRNQEKHLGEAPVRIGPAVDSLVSIVTPLIAPARSSVSPRGLSFGTGSMKNPPDGFYPDKCDSN